MALTYQVTITILQAKIYQKEEKTKDGHTRLVPGSCFKQKETLLKGKSNLNIYR